MLPLVCRLQRGSVRFSSCLHATFLPKEGVSSCHVVQEKPRHHRKVAQNGSTPAGPAPVEPASEAALPALHTPFAAAAAAAGSDAALPSAQGQAATALAPPRAPHVQGEEGQVAEFADARERKWMRQDTGGTIYFTPRTSPVPSAGAELPAQPAGMTAPVGAALPGPVKQQQAGAGMEAEGHASVHEASSGYSASGEESRGSEEEDVEVSAGRPKEGLACG